MLTAIVFLAGAACGVILVGLVLIIVSRVNDPDEEVNGPEFL